MMRSGAVSRCKDTNRVIEALADRWRISLTIDEILEHLAEVRSYERIGEYYEKGLISEEMAKRCIALLDEAL